MGTPQALSNEKGECVWEIALNTWGKVQEIKTQNPDNPLEQSDIRFQGQYYDEETGLHYNRYRYYEPFSARYISKDPIGLNGGLNNSSYVNDPNQWVDPMGLYVVLTFDKAKGTITGFDKESKKTINIKNVFTGGDVYAGVFNSNGTAIPNGKYYLVPARGHQDWYALFKDDGWIDDFDNNGRSGFRLHPGRNSLGCVTINKDDNYEQWNKLDGFIYNTKKTKLKVWSGGNSSWYSGFGWRREEVDNWGELHVK